MSRGKYLSLEEARKRRRFDNFAKEHPSEGDKGEFDRLFDAMIKGSSATEEASSPDSRACSSETRTRKGT
jgi:hypothetical protein